MNSVFERQAIFNKALSIAKSALSLDVEVDVIVCAFKYPNKVPFKNVKFLDLSEFGNPFCRWIDILNYIHDCGYDFFVLRYFTPTYGLYRALSLPAVPYITEHHTKETSELLSKLEIPALLQEYLFAKVCVGNASGVVGVTNEIACYELKRIGDLNKPYCVIPNGVDIEGRSLTSFNKFDGKNLKMIFLISKVFPWHGIERLLNGFLNYKNHEGISVELFVVGDVKEDYFRRFNVPEWVKIECLGYLTGLQLENIIKEMNLAVSTLGILKKKMVEACPLKSREYMAFGIPFIYSYNDPDIPDNFPYALKLPIEDKPVDINMIFEFVRSLAKENPKDVSIFMREFAKQKLDWKVKIRQYIDFIKTL